MIEVETSDFLVIRKPFHNNILDRSVYIYICVCVCVPSFCCEAQVASMMSGEAGDVDALQAQAKASVEPSLF